MSTRIMGALPGVKPLVAAGRGGGAGSVAVALSLGGDGWPSPRPYLSITCQRGRIETKVISAAEASTTKPDAEDLFWNRVTAEFVAKPQSGSLIRHVGRIPGIGDDVGTQMLRTLMYSGGRRVTGKILATIPDLATVVSFALVGLIRRIRRTLGETGKSPYFIITDVDSYRWNIERNWRYIVAQDEFDDFDAQYLPGRAILRQAPKT